MPPGPPEAFTVAAPVGPTVKSQLLLCGVAPVYCSVPLSITRSVGEPVPSPMALGLNWLARFATLSTPPLMTVGPVYVFKALSVSVPGPNCVRPPTPVIGPPLNCVPCTILSLRLKASVPSLTIVLLVGSAPAAPPAPTCSVPLSISVLPV